MTHTSYHIRPESIIKAQGDATGTVLRIDIESSSLNVFMSNEERERLITASQEMNND